MKSQYELYILPAPNQITSEVAKFQSIQISSKDSIDILQKILIATNSTDYNTIMKLLNKSMNCKAFLSYYEIIKHQPELDNGIVWHRDY